MNEHRPAEALVDFRSVYARTGNEESLIRLAGAYFVLRQYDSIFALVPDAEKQKTAAPPPALMIIAGDALTMRDDTARAAAVYHDVLRYHYSRAIDEAVTNRLTWLALGSVLPGMKTYYRAEDDSARREVLRTMIAPPAGPAAEFHFYLQLRLAPVTDTASTEWTMVRDVPSTLPDELQRYSYHIHAARILLAHGAFERAKYHFWTALNFTVQVAEKNSAEKQIELCNWYTRHHDF